MHFNTATLHSLNIKDKYIFMAEKQKTLESAVTLKGKGLHTGVEVQLIINPAPEDYGYKFVRTDLEDSPVIPALAEYVIDTSRGTVISNKDARVSTIEHLLSALYSLGIDNAMLEVDGPEVPIMNGSAQPFVDAILKAGIKEQNVDRYYYEIKEKTIYRNDDKGIEIIAYPDTSLSFDVKIGYDSPFLKNQFASINQLENFVTEIAPCRTFCFFREIEMLAKANLIKGGDLDNAIVIVDHEVTSEEIDRVAQMIGKDVILKVEEQGILNNVALKFENEPARHKLLDLVGDLSLCGAFVKGRIIATHPGHFGNTEFAKILRKSVKKEKSKPQPPKIDIYATPAYNIEDIKRILPHRYPFQLIDKIMYLTETEIVGIKNVTNNEPFFQGHFPEEAVMPGVLQLEAIGQCGGVLALKSVEDPELYSTYFLGMDKIKYRKKVIPGDVLVFRLRLMSPIRRGIVQMRAEVFVGEDLVAEGELMAQIVKNKG